MVDFLENSRQTMIDNLQISLRAVRNIMGFSAQELGDFIGVTRQTVNNLETGKSKMAPMQYIALSAVIDNYVTTHDEMLSAIETIIDGNRNRRNESYDSSFHNSSLLKRWFACFGDFGYIKVTWEENLYGADYNALINNLIGGYKVFIAADTLMYEGFHDFISMFSDCLYSAKAKIIIPLRVVEQIQQKLTIVEESSQAINALKIINDLQRRGVAELRGESGDTNSQNTILSVFAKFRSSHRLCLITQDELFANEITRLNHTSGKQGFNILAGYIDGNGAFRLYCNAELLEVDNDNLENYNVATQIANDYTMPGESNNDSSTTDISMIGWDKI